MKRNKLRTVLLVLLVVGMISWNGVLTYQSYIDYQALRTTVMKQNQVNDYFYTLFMQLSIWAKTVEARLAPTEQIPMSYTPAQWRPAPVPRREVLYVRITDDKNFTAVEVAGMLCVVNTKTGTYTCEVP